MSIRMGTSFDRHYFSVIEDIEERLVDPMTVPARMDNQEIDVGFENARIALMCVNPSGICSKNSIKKIIWRGCKPIQNASLTLTPS